MPARFEKNVYKLNKLTKLALAAAALISFGVKAEADQTNVNQMNYNQLGLFVINQADLVNYSMPVQITLISPAVKPEVMEATSATTMTIPLTPQVVAEDLFPSTMYAEWNRVHECEEPEVYARGELVSGGWHVKGSISSGGLGILNSNWIKYGGTFFAPSGNLASPKEQMIIASHIESNPPDQNGCDPGGW